MTHMFCHADGIFKKPNIQWQPEPDKDLLKLVELCGGVWPESDIKGITRRWEASSPWIYSNPDYVRLSNNSYKGKLYTKNQFEAAKLYVERKRKEMSPLDIAEDVIGVCFDTCKVKEKENKSMPTIKDGSWINIQGLTQEQSQYCIDWLAERTGKKTGKASEYDLGCAQYYKNHAYIQDVDNNLEIKASDILPDSFKKKPPIGIMPKSFWLSKRKDELQAAINRYIAADLEPLPEWKEEVDWIDAMEHNDADNQLLEIDQTVFNEYGAELTVYRIDDDKGVLCSDLQWYSADQLIVDKKVIAVYKALQTGLTDNETAMDLALHIVDKF